MKPEITVLICDDHPIFREGLKQIVAGDPRLTVVGEAEDGESALAKIEQYTPQVVVLDLDMPQKDGFEVARVIREKKLAVQVIILTMHKDERMLNAALDLGVKGYVLKDSAITEIVASIKAVAERQDYISPQLSSYLLKRNSRAAALLKQQPGLESLTATERRVLKLIAEYKTSKEIAGLLFISIRTVEHHRANICEKLDLRGSHALLKFATEHQAEL
jgi:DNA-binding NarL/FixJ family response regulator